MGPKHLSSIKLRALALTSTEDLEKRVAKTLDREEQRRWRNLREVFREETPKEGETSFEIIDRLVRNMSSKTHTRRVQRDLKRKKPARPGTGF